MLLSADNLIFLFTFSSLITKYVLLPLVTRIYIPRPQHIEEEVPALLDLTQQAHLNLQANPPVFNVDVRNLYIDELLTNYACNPGLPTDYWNLCYLLFCVLSGLCVLNRFGTFIRDSINHKVNWFDVFGIVNTVSVFDLLMRIPYLNPLQLFIQSCKTLGVSFLFIDNPLIYISLLVLNYKLLY